MVIVTACWGLGYAALVMATIAYLWPSRHRLGSVSHVAGALVLISVLLQWGGMLSRALVGHGWPVVSTADRASAIGLLLLTLYLVWRQSARGTDPGPVVAAIALLLLSYGLGHYLEGMLTEPVPSLGVLIESLLNALGGSLLALAAACSVASWLPRKSGGPPETKQVPLEEKSTDESDRLVRGALLCLALGLAIDTWWLQKVGLGAIDDAQQAGIAVSWMVYFIALRLRSSPYWRGWPWTAMLVAGFVCTLPMLVQVSWLGTSLPL
jgi:hypothetical protein